MKKNILVLALVSLFFYFWGCSAFGSKIAKKEFTISSNYDEFKKIKENTTSGNILKGEQSWGSATNALSFDIMQSIRESDTSYFLMLTKESGTIEFSKFGILKKDTSLILKLDGTKYLFFHTSNVGNEQNRTGEDTYLCYAKFPVSKETLLVISNSKSVDVSIFGEAVRKYSFGKNNFSNFQKFLLEFVK